MFTVIAHDFEVDSFEGSRDFDSLDDAHTWAQQFSSEVADYVTVWIQSDGIEDEMIKTPS